MTGPEVEWTPPITVVLPTGETKQADDCTWPEVIVSADTLWQRGSAPVDDAHKAMLDEARRLYLYAAQNRDPDFPRLG